MAEREGGVVRLESYEQLNIKKRIRSIVTSAKWREDRKKQQAFVLFSWASSSDWRGRFLSLRVFRYLWAITV